MASHPLKSSGHCRRCGQYVTERHGISHAYPAALYCAACIAKERETYRKLRKNLTPVTEKN